ncbi:unnamed protein product [Ceutorhynchus assimilis]|uniref:C2H2-type domain-containing protein n=1 Tax=Ceutorhynchus assimilis TaxID=467358 RepID=A0A9N9MRC3_9CUCU|nr:unnamed protein product [Ceutorhynchus assimilis]
MEDNDADETLVLNFLPDQSVVPEVVIGIDKDASESTKLDGSFDENQNQKITTKPENRELGPENTPLPLKMKKLVVMLDEVDLTPKKRKRKSIVPNPLSAAKIKKTATPRNTRTSSANSSLSASKTPKLAVKETPKRKKLVQQKLQFKPLVKKPENAKCDANNDVVVKIENFYADEVVPVSKPVTKEKHSGKDHKNNNQVSKPSAKQIKDVDVRSKDLQEDDSKFKLETDTKEYEPIKKGRPIKSLRNEGTKPVTNSLKIPGERKFYRCDHCPYMGSSRANLERHNMIHMSEDDILWYKCSDCEYKSKYEAQLRSHVIIHKDPKEIEWFPCPHCDLKCSRKHNLTNHIKTAHLDRVNNFKCEKCSYATFSNDRLVAHSKSHSDKIFGCKLCKFITKNDDYLKNHVKLKHSETDERPFPCDTCSYKGRTKRELVRHYDRMHNKEKMRVYRCELCDFNSIYKKNMEFHVLHMHKNSEGFQKFICGHCNKQFAYKNGLKTHIIRIHLKFSEEDWQRCRECKYKTKDVGTLKRHIKRNHGAPRLLCKQCNFATNRLKSMVAHEKTHKADCEDILKCPKCPYRIIQASSFVYHMKIIHGIPLNSKDLYKYYENDDKKIKEKFVSESE